LGGAGGRDGGGGLLTSIREKKEKGRGPRTKRPQGEWGGVSAFFSVLVGVLPRMRVMGERGWGPENSGEKRAYHNRGGEGGGKNIGREAVWVEVVGGGGCGGKGGRWYA